MTCGHCASAVTEELSALGTVTGVSVDLKPGEESRVTVTSEEPLATASVRAAIEDAGYTLA
nr:heavy-metal-associated domain-containing protein [Microbacterium agarici]